MLIVAKRIKLLRVPRALRTPEMQLAVHIRMPVPVFSQSRVGIEDMKLQKHKFVVFSLD